MYEPLSGRGATSHEATAWSCTQACRWSEALTAVRSCQLDQPVSSRPAIRGSYIAVVALMDFAAAVEIARLGRVANPDRFVLRSNFVVAAAEGGRITNAERGLTRIDSRHLGPLELIVYKATAGLLEYRQGNAERGRKPYLDALASQAQEIRPRHRALAALFFARQEMCVRGPEYPGIRSEALALVEAGQFPEMSTLTAYVREGRSSDTT